MHASGLENALCARETTLPQGRPAGRMALNAHERVREATRTVATMRTELLRFSGGGKQDPAIDVWMKEHARGLGAIAHQWFEGLTLRGGRVAGDDQPGRAFSHLAHLDPGRHTPAW